MASSRSFRPVSLKIKGTACTVTLPTGRDKLGELEWANIGEILTPYITEEVESASKIDFRYGTRVKSERKPQTGWKYLHEKHDVMVFEKKISGSPVTCFMGRGVVNVPLQELSEFIQGVENNMTWDDLLIEARYLKVLSQSDKHIDYIGYQQFESTTCYFTTRRDMLYYVRCLNKENKYIQTALSVNDPEYPIPAGVKRIEVFLGSGFVLEPYQGSATQTLVTYLAHTDLKGIPFFVMNHILKRHPLAVHHIRRQFLSRPSTPATTPDNHPKKRAKKRGESTLSSPDDGCSCSPMDAHSLRRVAIPSACFEEPLSVGDFMS